MSYVKGKRNVSTYGILVNNIHAEVFGEKYTDAFIMIYLKKKIYEWVDRERNQWVNT